jgi:hypothetical protein
MQPATTSPCRRPETLLGGSRCASCRWAAPVIPVPTELQALARERWQALQMAASSACTRPTVRSGQAAVAEALCVYRQERRAPILSIEHLVHVTA